ncbi:hypothetical protein CIB84_000263, partial [Bambusicola thoracicus]
KDAAHQPRQCSNLVPFVNWYFLVDLEGPPSIVSTMMDHLGRDIDIIRRAFIKYPVSKTEECSGIVPVNYEDKLIPKKK